MPARPALQPGERVLVSTRAHGARLTRPFLVLLLTVFALSTAQRALELRWRPVAEPWTTVHAGVELTLLVVAGWVVLRSCLRPLSRWWRTRYVLTTRHLVLLRPGGPRKTVSLPLHQLRRVDVERRSSPALGRRDGRVVADFGPLGGLRLEHAPEANRLAGLIRRAAEDQWAAGGGTGRTGDPGSGGGAPGLPPTRVDRDAVVAPRRGPSVAPRRPWSRRAVHHEEE
ncbi:PH domain-containing protein [Kocuria sp. M4R2S49]|uniref:PH domain-containing protein n=1 Tax=Kocuria rhizosphaericola TaxID=3376284 RepID=UPI00378963C8